MNTDIKTTYPRTKGISLAALFAALLSIASVVSIPMPFVPVPVTLQVLVVFLILCLLGPFYGALSCSVYLLLGTAGIPVFAGATAGPGIVIGPLGGYLLSFPIAVFLGGLVSGPRPRTKREDAIRLSLAVSVALATVYLIGAAWLGLSLRLDMTEAFALGAAPFIPIDATKALVAIPFALRLRWTGTYYLPVHSAKARQGDTEVHSGT